MGVSTKILIKKCGKHTDFRLNCLIVVPSHAKTFKNKGFFANTVLLQKIRQIVHLGRG